ncbi:hypothetical protein OESDEN_13605 [Oesophagostomum dentatum]|uniref:RyR/IP3R Homology associated domain-containing protein n=1 Tax=Oesophagostomum dentatum TaxID=61180 RepID=A0A0B1SS08_OESDE|nr:hypothetical protein OESDEN_13605 [Oesophagostomum dentatum]
MPQHVADALPAATTNRSWCTIAAARLAATATSQSEDYEAPLEERSLYEIQCRLNEAGASDLVIDIIINEPSREIFVKAIQLAKALLLEGNDKVQQSFYERLKKKDTHEPFFKALSQRIQTAQNRLKSDMMSCSESKPKGASTVLTPVLEHGHVPFPGTFFDPSHIRQPSLSEISNHSHEMTASVPDLSPYQDDEKPSDALPPEVSIIEPILRVLQLLCENHNSLLQNFIRRQSDRANHNLVAETLSFLDTVCSRDYSYSIMATLITQTLATLTEFCQGPCHENQNTMAMQENGLKIIISPVLKDIKPLADDHMELALEIKSQASKLLLAIMESRHDSENAERVLQNMDNTDGGPRQLVGHNIYILAHQLSRHSPELAHCLDPDDERKPSKTRNALSFYKAHTAQIEIVRQDRTLERVVFPIHEICSFLTKETKQTVYYNTERDNQGSKVTEFFDQWPALYQEMKWQRKLQDRPYLSACTQRLRLWGRLAFLFAVLVNTIIALYYPFETADTGLYASNPFMYTSVIVSVIFLYSQWDEKYCVEDQFSPIALGDFSYCFCFQLANKVVHLVAYASNKGLKDKSWAVRLSDGELHYHLAYLTVCCLGLVVHPMLYCLLVSNSGFSMIL